MASKKRTAGKIEPFLLKYKSLANALNAMFNHANINATARALQKFEQNAGRRYEFGNWAPTLGAKLGDEEWGGRGARETWVSSVADIPAVLRKQLGYLIRENVLATPPTPIIFDVLLGADHGVVISYGQDDSTGGPVDAVLITIVCKS